MTEKNKTGDLQEMVSKRQSSDYNGNEDVISEIIEQGLKGMKEFVNLDMKTIEKKPRHVTDIRYKQARLTFDLIREQNVQARANEGLKVRVYHLIAEDKEELKQLVTASLPSYLPK